VTWVSLRVTVIDINRLLRLLSNVGDQYRLLSKRKEFR